MISFTFSKRVLELFNKGKTKENTIRIRHLRQDSDHIMRMQLLQISIIEVSKPLMPKSSRRIYMGNQPST